MKKTIRIIEVLCISMIMTLSSYFTAMPVSADSYTPEVGDTIRFANRDWHIINIDSSEIFLYAQTPDTRGGYFAYPEGPVSSYGEHSNSTYFSYIGNRQDTWFENTYYPSIAQEERDLIKAVTIKSEYFDLSGYGRGAELSYSGTMSGGSATRHVYAISAEEYAKYCAGTSWAQSVMGNFTTVEGDICIWTRTGRRVNRGTPARPVFIHSSGELDNMNYTRPVDTTTYSLTSQKNHATAENVSNFSIPSNSTPSFRIAGSTPAGVYDLVIQVTRTLNLGSVSTVINNGGCYERTMCWRAALRLDRSKVNAKGMYYSGGKWYIGGGTVPTRADLYQSGTKTFSTSAQDQAFTGANKTIKIYYTLTINKATNPISISSSSSGSKVFSEETGTQTFNANVSGAQGAVTYSIKSQKVNGSGVTYFSIENASSPTFTIAAGTPVGTYTIEVNVTAAGNNNYNAGTKVHTYTLTVTQANNTVKFDNQSGEVYFRNSDQNSPTVQPAYDNQGDITYSIVAQKNSANENITNFSIPDNSSPNFAIAAGTPVGFYTITMRATAAGNLNYKSGYVDMTYTLEVKQSSIPEIEVFYYKGTPNSSSTHEGEYIENNKANAKYLDTPYLIDIHAQDRPFEVGSPVFGITKLYYEISTDGGHSWGQQKVLYDGPATLDLLQYNSIKVSETPGIYYIRVTGINDVNNTGRLQDIYRVGKAPAIFVHNQNFIVGADVDLERIRKSATAYDTKEGDISDRIVVEYIINNRGEELDISDPNWKLDTSTVTNYDVTYSVTNSDGKTAMSTSTISIVTNDPDAVTTNALDIYDRYIDKDFINSLQNNSIWNSNNKEYKEEYADLLEKAYEQESVVVEMVIRPDGSICKLKADGSIDEGSCYTIDD